MGLSVFLHLWLCYASKTLHNPTKRLYCFLSTLYACLSRNARAVLQFYPENDIGQGLPFKAATSPGRWCRTTSGEDIS
ncbi:18S rRNA (guanine-N(7))-methyltransferase-like isoform X4 [Temnothorax americanus]|uniref:18S rRNA (guanine-N(7))-methyltransferase-like isoform X4 n=1 Tax=Temnothorax americanus TaxID=1964332 RepID=UPI004069375B